jgi:hypothetical protein
MAHRRNKAKVQSSKAKGPESVENRGAARLFLKKQSQFPGVPMNVKAFSTKYYDDLAALRLPKDKARQSQTPAVGAKFQARNAKS